MSVPVRVAGLLAVALLTISAWNHWRWLHPDLPARYVDAVRGDIPVLIAVPHDGDLDRPGLPPRFPPIDGRDVGTRNISTALEEALREGAGQPYLVVQKLRRSYVDTNRDRARAYQHPLGREVYDTFHQQIERFAEEIRDRFGDGVLLDMHGNPRLPKDVYLGTYAGAALTETAAGQAFEDDLRQALRAAGYEVPPRDETPEVFGGDFIVDRHGAKARSPLSAVMIEIHRRHRSELTDQRRVGVALADGVLRNLQRRTP